MNKLGKSSKAITPRVKLALLFVLIVSCLALTGCDPGSFNFTPEYLAGVERVELIKYDNPAQKHFSSWVPDHTKDLKPFDGAKVSVIDTLDADKFPDFTDSLCKCRILHTYFAYDSPNGLCIKLSYSNGDFLIVSCNLDTFAGYIGKYSSDGQVSDFIGCFESYEYFGTLVRDYFPSTE